MNEFDNIKFYVQLIRRGKPVSDKRRMFVRVVNYKFSETGEWLAYMTNDAPVFFEVISSKWYHKYGLMRIKADTALVTDDRGRIFKVPLRNAIKTENQYAVRIASGNLRFDYYVPEDEKASEYRKAWGQLAMKE